MSAIGLFILQVVILQSTNAQFGGGPSTFGYDASSACSKPYSRQARQRFEELPCDFRRQNWCTIPGSAYPWKAVRRFVQENHGLMRRMYGDERHINILKSELEKNDIEFESKERYEKYSEESRSFQYENGYEYEDLDKEESRTKSPDESDEGRSFLKRSFDGQTTERSRKYTTSSIESTSDHTRTTDSPVSSPSSSGPTSTSSIESSSTSDTITTTESLTIQYLSSSLSTVSIDKKNSTEYESRPNNSTSAEKIPSIVPAVTLADIAKIKNSSINEIPGQLERVKDLGFNGSGVPIVTESIIEDMNSSSIDRLGEAESDETQSSVSDQDFSSSEQEPQLSKPKPDYKPTGGIPMNLQRPISQNLGSSEKSQQPIKLQGVNACHAKQEVVAPFWANNTRGEILALLNLYPFEQYVHWEKCTQENKQMFCRDGCKCEQQYRLHRLLAYDPNNECRGIFSDWFKFPSCCVCRCYDLPLEFRLPSRSPRVLQKQKRQLSQLGKRQG